VCLIAADSLDINVSKNFHLIVGDVSANLAEYATTQDSSAYLIDRNNLSQNHSGVAYTSLGDLNGTKELFQLLSTADEITYYPPIQWSDRKKSDDRYSMAWFSEHYIGITKNIFGIKVNFLPKIWDMPEPSELRKTDSTQLWVAGCSTTVGVGVNANERYANILSNRFNLPVSLLAESAAAVPWAADQILRSDIRKGDIVIFGVTTYSRITMFQNQKINHVGNSSIKNNCILNFPELTIQQLDSDTRIYECVRAVNHVVNFCNKVEAKLILIGIHANLEVSLALSKHKNFVFCHGKFGADFRDEWLDFGSDVGVGSPHPGPKTHQMYADLIVSKARELDFIH
jgi:hypothetical protein